MGSLAALFGGKQESKDGGDEDANVGNKQIAFSFAVAPAPVDDDGKMIEKILEPFSKDQLVNFLRDTTEIHRDVADCILRRIDEDPIYRKSFVNELGWDTTTETLNADFKRDGEIEDSKAVMGKVSEKSKGYGFILFKRQSGARKALREPLKNIGNQMNACQLASVDPVQMLAPVAPVSQQVSEYTQRKIYVSNVGAELDPHKATSFFAKYGEIEEGF